MAADWGCMRMAAFSYQLPKFGIHSSLDKEEIKDWAVQYPHRATRAQTLSLCMKDSVLN